MEFIYFLISIIGLGISTYTDLKERIVPDKLSYSLIAIGLIGHLVQGFVGENFQIFFDSVFVTIYAFLGGYLFYRLGLWAGGDVKLITGLAALNPVNYGVLRDFIGLQGTLFSSLNYLIFPISLFVLSVFALLPYSLFIPTIRILKSDELKKEVFEDVKNKAVKILGITISLIGATSIVSFFGLDTLYIFPLILLISFLPDKIQKIIIVVMFAYSLISNFINSLSHAGYLFVSLIIMYGLFKFYFVSKKVLKKEFKITELEEGMISGEKIVEENGEVKKIKVTELKDIIELIKKQEFYKLKSAGKVEGKEIISDKDAGGLTVEQIEKLKDFVKKGKLENKLVVKESTAVVPAILIAYALLQIFGDFFWNLII